MECCIQLAYEDKLYTDYDNRDETRAKKLRLLGLAGEVTEYRYDDIRWIVANCDKVYLLNPTDRVGAFTKVFEEVFKRLEPDDIPKIITYVDSNFIGWSVVGKQASEEFDQYGILNSIYDIKQTYDWLKIQTWHKIFMWAWYRLYDVEDRGRLWSYAHSKIVEQLRNQSSSYIGDILRAESTVDHTTTIHSGRYAYSYKNNYKILPHIDILCSERGVFEVIQDLFNWSKGKVFPYYYNKEGNLLKIITESPYTRSDIVKRLSIRDLARVIVE